MTNGVPSGRSGSALGGDQDLLYCNRTGNLYRFLNTCSSGDRHGSACSRRSVTRHASLKASLPPAIEILRSPYSFQRRHFPGSAITCGSESLRLSLLAKLLTMEMRASRAVLMTKTLEPALAGRSACNVAVSGQDGVIRPKAQTFFSSRVAVANCHCRRNDRKS